MSDLKHLTLLANAARAWNNEDEPALDAAMEEIEIFLLARRTQPEATKPAQDLGAAILEGAEGSDAPEENALFEADMRKHGYWDADLKRNGSGLYVHDHVHRMWTGWMARAALASPADALVAVDRCTCPSGDGSLRWPCPQHPPLPVAITDKTGPNGIKWYVEPNLPDGVNLYIKEQK